MWPEVVDNLASAVRAGLSLPEALSALGDPRAGGAAPAVRAGSAPTTARPAGSATCLDRLKDDLADPVGDRIVETLRVAREVGGTDLGRVLRTLSTFLREDARTRAELETRQGWVGQRGAARGRRAVGGAAAAGHPVDDAAPPTTPRPGTAMLLGGGAVCWWPTG